MRRTGGYTRTACSFVCLIAVMFSTGCAPDPFPRKAEITLRQASPSGSYVVEISHNAHDMDRNLSIVLTDTRVASPPRVIFTSPDELRPSAERIIWADDESAFLVASKSVMVAPDIRLATEEHCYLLYSIHRWRLWCNASQSSTDRFGPVEIKSSNINVHLKDSGE